MDCKNEREMVKYLLCNQYEAIELLLQSKVKLVETEVSIPRGSSRKARSIGRIDILVQDTEDRWHIVEVKNPKSDILENSKGIAQLLFYDAMFWEKEGINATSLNLVTSSFDPILKEIVPRNNLKVRVAELSSGALNVIVGYSYKPGRPKEYKDYFAEEVYKYVIECAEASKGNDIRLPTVEDLAVRMGFSKETLYKWASEKREFSDALEFLKNKQCVALINNGLANKYNPTIAKLILSSNHNMRERKDVTSDDKPIGQILDELENE